jgi:hypothetical protein
MIHLNRGDAAWASRARHTGTIAGKRIDYSQGIPLAKPESAAPGRN